MLVTIRTFASFKEVFGDPTVVGVPEGESALGALAVFCEQKGAGKERLFTAGGALMDHVILAVNGVRIEPSEAASRVLFEGDVIAAYPPVSGG